MMARMVSANRLSLNISDPSTDELFSLSTYFGSQAFCVRYRAPKVLIACNLRGNRVVAPLAGKRLYRCENTPARRSLLAGHMECL